jgi:hypothetical protein
MKTTISGRPNAHKIEFPCLVNLKSDKDLVFLVTLVQDSNSNVCCMTQLNGNHPNGCFNIYKNTLLSSYEYFVGELTLQNN